MALTIGSSFFFINCLRKVKQNQRSLKTAPQTQNQANTEASFLSLCEATYFTCLQTLQHMFMFAFLLIRLVQVHFREVSTCLSQQSASHLFCHSSKMAACEQPPGGSAVKFPLHLSSLRKLRTPLSLPTLKEPSTTNLFLWHIEVLLHYNPCSLVFFFFVLEKLWPVIV